MPDGEARRFRLHFEGPLTQGHSVPALALVQALQQFQRVVHLLAMAEEGREVRQRARVTHEIEKRFPLVCSIPKEGGYALPVVLGDTTDQLFDAPIIEAVAVCAQKTLRAVNAANDEDLRKLLPDPYFRRGVLTAFAAMQPPRRSGVVVSIEDYKDQKLLDGTTARARIERLLVRPQPSPAAEPSYVTGALIEMKFQERRLRLQLLPSSRGLDASYSDDFEPVLLDHPRDLIQVHGNVVYGDDGLPASISDVDDILEVDESPLEARTIALSGRVLRAIQPVSFEVSFDRTTQQYEAAGPFDISLCAQTRPELEGMLDAELAMLWAEYAEANPSDLTTAAIRLREELRAAFEVSTDAA